VINPKRSTVSRLQSARHRQQLALDACPHWDFETESPGAEMHPCCFELEEANRILADARKAYREEIA
jgi:hypothetical protein